MKENVYFAAQYQSYAPYENNPHCMLKNFAKNANRRQDCHLVQIKSISCLKRSLTSAAVGKAARGEETTPLAPGPVLSAEPTGWYWISLLVRWVVCFVIIAHALGPGLLVSCAQQQ